MIEGGLRRGMAVYDPETDMIAMVTSVDRSRVWLSRPGGREWEVQAPSRLRPADAHERRTLRALVLHHEQQRRGTTP
ncbi:hypothetical protein ABZ951_04485 [Streptomyces sp. NPDC046215]|uniref:Uncharacterized protein n=1 Tax=Streptomyces stramineus TaxID=173861 RepID=A0ABN0ZQW4_9ACTN